MEVLGTFACIAGPLIIWLLVSTIRKNRKISNISARRVFITGCDTGFGRSLVLRLDREGVCVYAGCLRQSAVDEIALSCSKRVKAFLIDVTNSQSIHAAAEKVKSDLNGRALWAIVNNAGILGSRIPFEWTTREHCRSILEVNLLGTYEVTLAFLPLMKFARQGRIVNMSSANGRYAITAHGYSISKFGVEGFSDGLWPTSCAPRPTLSYLFSYDVKPFNLTVHVIEPGLFKTSMVNTKVERRKITDDFRKTSAEIQKCYGEGYLNRYLDYVTTMFDGAASADIYQVVDAYEHAILGRYPKSRYLVGGEARYIAGPLSYMPQYLQMLTFRVVEKLMGTSVPVPQSCIER